MTGGSHDGGRGDGGRGDGGAGSGIPWRGPAEVLSSELLAPGTWPYHRLVLRAPAVAAEARPGQFAHLLCPPRPGAPAPPGIPHLRRPFSFHDADAQAGTVTIVFEAYGPGTWSLALARPGESIDLIGPLGDGAYPSPEPGPVWLVGGGAGIAPMFYLARRLVAGGAGTHSIQVIIGVPDGRHLGLAGLFQTLVPEVEVVVAAEAGAPGAVHGLPTAVLETALARAGRREGGAGTIYACGPWPMLVAVRRLAAGSGAAAWISTGEYMACGVGACRSCAIPVRGPVRYRRSCRDGPVFAAEDLDWEAIASALPDAGGDGR